MSASFLVVVLKYYPTKSGPVHVLLRRPKSGDEMDKLTTGS